MRGHVIVDFWTMRGPSINRRRDTILHRNVNVCTKYPAKLGRRTLLTQLHGARTFETQMRYTVSGKITRLTRGRGKTSRCKQMHKLPNAEFFVPRDLIRR